MTKRFSRSYWRILLAGLPIVLGSVAIAADRTEIVNKRPTMRAASEKGTLGLTHEAFTTRQLRLHTQLTAEKPVGVENKVIRVDLSNKDLADLSVNPNANGPAPLRIGVVKAARVKAFEGGVLQSENGISTWAITVSSPGAQSIRVHFTNLSLPDGAQLYFYSSNGQANGPYTGTGRNENGDFWTRSIISDTGIIQIRFNEADKGKISFEIMDIAHIRGRPPRPQPQSHDSWPCSDNAPCVVDVNCVNTGPAAPAEDAVAKMEWIQGPFINTCSGGLLADTDTGSQIPYFLTANHCLSTNNSSLETFFNYTTDSCNGGCPDSLVTGGSPPSASTIGVTVVATGSAGDFTLLTLDQAPPAGAIFLGWNNAPVANSNGANLYRVSNANFGPQVYSQHDVDSNSPECTGWPRGERIYSLDQTGATMGGSSGSPVLNANGEVVGQLSGCCGFNCADECDSANNWTVDGALAFYWNSVSEFLDPVAGCSGDPECDDGLYCTGTETCVSGSCQSSGNPCSGGETCNESTNSCDMPACDNNGSCDAGEDCNNCPNDCRSKLNGNPNSRYCCDGDLPDCGDTRCSESGFSCGGSGSCTTDPECNDGQFCNGEETCVGGSCQSGSDSCPGQGCDEGADVCVTCGGNKDSCTVNGDCCSNNCRSGSCRGN